MVPPSGVWPLHLVFAPPAAKSWRRAWGRGAHLLSSTARIQSDIRLYCFSCCKLRCYLAKCVLLLSFNVQSDIFAVMIAWSQRSVIRCGNPCRRLLTLFEIFGAVFLFILCGNAVPAPLFLALHP